MRLFGLALQTLALYSAAACVAIAMLYLIRPRPRRVVVPFSRLWQRVLADRDASQFWSRFRRLFSFLLALVIALLCLWSLGDPRTSAKKSASQHVVLIVDTSVSMQARDKDEKTRFQKAQEAARKTARKLGDDDFAIVLRTDGLVAQPAFASGADSATGAISALSPTDAPGALARTIAAAEAALKGRANPRIIVFSDGCDPSIAAEFQSSAQATAPAEATDTSSGKVLRQYVKFGDRTDNVAITAFSTRRYPANREAYEVLLEVANFGAEPAEAKLEISSERDVIDARSVSLAPGERSRVVLPNRSGGGALLEASIKLANPDALSADDHAFALLPSRARDRVLVVGQSNMFIEGAFLSDDRVELFRMSLEEWEALSDGDQSSFSAVVFDRVLPAKLPDSGGFLMISPPRDRSPFTVTTEVTRPSLSDVASRHPLLKWVSLSDVNISRADVYELGPNDTAIASFVRQPIVVARDEGRRKIVAIGFDVAASDLPLRIAWPVFLVNSLVWFSGDGVGARQSFATGAVVSARIAQDSEDSAEGVSDELKLIGPGNRTVDAVFSDGRATWVPRTIGVYQTSVADAPIGVANLEALAESQLTPLETLALGARQFSTQTPIETHEAGRPLWAWLLLGAFALVAVEWFTYHRRTTV